MLPEGYRLHGLDPKQGGGSVYRIRIATPRDLDVILHHRRRMFEDMGFRDENALAEMLETSSPRLGNGLEDGSYRGWLVETEGGEIVAGGGVIRHPFHSHPRDPRSERAWIVNMFTEEEHRRRGLARRLLETILDALRHEGMRFVYLHASAEARPLYESLGFTPTNEMKLTL
jgi:GNAT superfamily N-acetyltransferase